MDETKQGVAANDGQPSMPLRAMQARDYAEVLCSTDAPPRAYLEEAELIEIIPYPVLHHAEVVAIVDSYELAEPSGSKVELPALVLVLTGYNSIETAVHVLYTMVFLPDGSWCPELSIVETCLVDSRSDIGGVDAERPIGQAEIDQIEAFLGIIDQQQNVEV
jgi:hypothetical protein